MDTPWEELKERIFSEIDMTREISDEELMLLIEEEVRIYGRSHLLSLKQRQEYERSIFNALRRLDLISELTSDPEITEILINGPQHIFYEKNGRLYPWNGGGLSQEKLADLIQQIAGRANRTVNEAQPILDTRLEDGSRVNIVMSPVAVDGSAISIRRFPKEPMTLDRLVALGSVSLEMAKYLTLLVRAGYNIFVSGGTGSGKTTMLNALSEQIPVSQRVVTIEDSAELQMKHIPNLVRLETRVSNGSGTEPITIRDLIRTALRMRPDRIIVGEVRGGECTDMLQAMNTGHDGSLSTGHANSCEDMLSRLEMMVLLGGVDLPIQAIRRQIVSGVDILVHLGRMRDRTRKVLHIAEIDGIRDGEIVLNTLFQFEEEEGKGEKVHGIWRKKGSLHHRGKMEGEGLMEEFSALETAKA